MTNEDLHPRRPAVVSVAASLAFHGLLLAAVIETTLPATRPAELIRLTLVPGGGRGEVRGGLSAQAAGPAADQAKPLAEVVAARKAILRPAPPRSEPKIARPVKAKPAIEPVPPPPAQSVPVVASIPVEPAGSGVGATTGGQGLDGQGGGQGAGTGDGSGQGGGRGGGSGRGVGGGFDQRAYCVSCPEPSYPLLARTRGWEGTVDVGLAVRADGSVDRVIVRRSSGYEVLDRAAVNAAESSRFRPPTSEGERVGVEGYIQYRFKLAQKAAR